MRSIHRAVVCLPDDRWKTIIGKSVSPRQRVSTPWRSSGPGVSRGLVWLISTRTGESGLADSGFVARVTDTDIAARPWRLRWLRRLWWLRRVRLRRCSHAIEGDGWRLYFWVSWRRWWPRGLSGLPGAIEILYTCKLLMMGATLLLAFANISYT